VATTLDRLQPYVENIFDNEDLRANVARARANLHAARRRAESRKDFRKAAEDPGVRARLIESARAGRAAIEAIREGPQPPSPWPRRIRLVVAMAAVAGATAFYQSRQSAD
jgi:hypothetical protein